MRQYRYQDKVFEFEGCVSVEVENRWCKPWRIIRKYIDLFPYVWEKAENASGVRLTFTTDSESIGIKLFEACEGMKLDLFTNGTLTEKYICGKSRDITFTKQGKGEKRIEVWLDQRYSFLLETVCIDEWASIHYTVDQRKRWVHYGSSISHSLEAGSPSTIWTGIAAQNLGLNLTNLGFGGNCILEPMIGIMIKDLKCDLVTLKLGINCYNGALSTRSFEPNAIGLIRIIREKHVNIPIIIISPIFCIERENTRMRDNSLTLVEMRQTLKHVVEKFKNYGDNNIFYVDGIDILGPDKAEHMPDNLHPDAEGQFVMAKNFIKCIKSKRLQGI